MKYELTDETITTPSGVILHRIRALQDIPTICVKAGDLGGWVEAERNLSQDGDCWVIGSARVSGLAWVHGSAQVLGSAAVFGSAGVGGSAAVFGSAKVGGLASVSGSAKVSGSARVSGSAKVSGSAQVLGSAELTHPRHILTVGPVGSENRTVTAHRTRKGHQINAGCWSDTLDQLRERISDPETAWEHGDECRDMWQADYLAVCDLLAGRIKEWEQR